MARLRQVFDKWVEAQKESLVRTKEVLAAAYRQGAHEIGAALYGPGTVAQQPEYGMPATKPPSMVVEGLRGQEAGSRSRDDHQPSQLEQHMQRAEERAAHEPERDGRDHERE